jgi:hypothetical protein
MRCPEAFLGVAIGLSLALYAQAQTLESGTAPFGQGVRLVSPPTSPLPRLVVDCVSVEPAKMQARPAASGLDRPTCAALSVPVPAQSNRDLLKVSRADVSVSLGLTGDEQGFGLMRALASFSHFLDAGPFGGWQFRAEAQLSRPPDLESAYLIDERVRLSLTPPQLAGWDLRFDAGASTQGGLDPSSAAARGLDLSGDLSHGFVVPGLGQEHRFHLRLAEDQTQDRVWGTDQRTTSASLGYTHTIRLGLIGTDLAVIRTQPAAAPAATSTRVEVKFARPF